MGFSAHTTDGQALGAPPDYSVVADLALSAEAAVVWRFDLASNALIWHSGIQAVLGLDDEHEARARLTELVEPLAVTVRLAAVWSDFQLEQPHLAPDGTTKWIRLRARACREGARAVLTGIATDITALHQDRQALADLADRYRLLVDLSPDAICVHEAGVVTYTNPAGLRFLGATSPDQILGRPISALVHPDSIPEMMRRMQALNTHGAASEPSDAKLVRFDGSVIDVVVVSVRTAWEGRPAYQVILRDVTAQKAAEAALRFQAALVSHVSDAIIATTAEGLVTSWNPAAETVYRHAAADAVGRPVEQLVGAQLDPGVVLHAGGVMQAVHRRSDGVELAVRVSAAEMDAGGYVLLCADETARRQAEQHFTTVVASLEEGVIVVGPTGLVESANPAAQRILGLREEQLVGASTADLVLHDENDLPVPAAKYPTMVTSGTGVPLNALVYQVRRRNGQNVWLSLSCRPLNLGGGLPAAVVVSFIDITEQRAIAARLEHQATHDELTGLANRAVVVDRLDAETARRRDGTTAVLFIDLDKFKVINDSLGHAVGDQVLRIVGERLRRTVRRDDVVGRLGGDEFVVISHDTTRPGQAHAIAAHVRDVVAQPINVGGRKLHVDASIGIVIAGPDDPRSGADLLRDADVAMYEAKTLGRGRHVIFDVDLRERVQRRLQLEQDLRDAVRRDQLVVAYQPIVDLRTDTVVSVEALLRWSHPVHGLVSPAEFIPLAEESDLINLLGAHVLNAAASAVSGFHAEAGVDVGLAVNLSPRQLDDPTLVEAVRRVLDATGLVPKNLCLEITESALMRDPVTAAETLNALREIGVELAIDDFGTGYSSLAQLRKLPIDHLKIDQSFIAPLGLNKEAGTIVRTIIAMAHAVGLIVIAEGVENEHQLETLRSLDCDRVQGYHLGRPGPVDDLSPRKRRK